jgi:DNA-binding response OmpR family regulator
VPASRKSPAGTAPRPSLLLVEEYDALAAAIGSALKKFAPAHDAHVVQSLDEAEAVAKKARPELFILDFDPPHAGIVAFLNKLKRTHPDARMLVIAATVARDLTAVRGLSGAIQFIEKPFELADFGAAVQALLGPWTSRSAEVSRGSLRHVDLVDALALVCTAGATTTIRAESGDEDAGEVHIIDGHIAHANTNGESGADALREMLTWSDVHFTQSNGRAKVPRTVHGPWNVVLLEALRSAGPVQRHAPEVPPKEKTRPRTGKKILIVDDTEMLSIFVEDVLTVADPDWQIFTAASGTDGLMQTETLLPDLVLLDYSMPDLKGDAVCRRLLSNEKTAQIPVIMMSGQVLEMTAVSAQLRNVVGTIEKPFFSDALVKLVRENLARGPLRIFEPPAQVIEQAPPPVVETPRPLDISPPEPAAVAPVPVPEKLIPETPLPPAPRVLSPASMPRTQFADSSENDVVLGLFLDVISMQLTPKLQMGAIRAKPSSLAVSLHVKSKALRGSIPAGTGFELGRFELDERGRIETVRLVPTRQPVEQIATRNALDIGEVAIVASNSHENVQLTSAASAPMTLQLLAEYEIGAVELSTAFEVSALVLKPSGQKSSVRFTSASLAGNGAQFETAIVRLDEAARISELTLQRAN